MVRSTILATTVALGAQLVQGQYIDDQVYPSPNATGAGDWHAAFLRATAAVAELNITEKAFLVTGVTGPCVGNIAAIPRIGFLQWPLSPRWTARNSSS
ncbi:hypothetical protein TMatcc_010233 [Talaromyces marneffei ATCC 18224]|nr:hypothetical protein EYB25_009287 [Talaromyces marneffei]